MLCILSAHAHALVAPVLRAVCLALSGYIMSGVYSLALLVPVLCAFGPLFIGYCVPVEIKLIFISQWIDILAQYDRFSASKETKLFENQISKVSRKGRRTVSRLKTKATLNPSTF